MKRSIMIATAAMAMFAMTNCATDKSRKAEVISKESVEQEVREFVYPLPTAFEVTEMLNRIEAAYMPAICNAKENYDKYMIESKRALNLGVYSADLCYANTYNQSALVKEYMDVIKKVIDALDMTQAMDPELPSKMESNENNKEELTKIITDTFYDSYDEDTTLVIHKIENNKITYSLHSTDSILLNNDFKQGKNYHFHELIETEETTHTKPKKSCMRKTPNRMRRLHS